MRFDVRLTIENTPYVSVQLVDVSDIHVPEQTLNRVLDGVADVAWWTLRNLVLDAERGVGPFAVVSPGSGSVGGDSEAA